MSRIITIIAVSLGTLLSAEPTYELSVCAMFQNEAQWLEEWIEYHQLVGVEHFFLYCDHSYDGYREVLEPYLESGVVDLVEWKGPGRRYAEGDARCDCIHYHGQDSQWVAFLSLNEYLVPIDGDSLCEELRKYGAVRAVTVDSVVFGTSGVEALAPGELMIEQLTRCATDVDGAIWIEQSAIAGGDVEPVIAEGLRVNHYWGRTEEWAYGEQLLRVRRTNPDRCDSWRTARDYVDEMVAKGNAREDHAILRFVPSLREK